MAHWETLLFDLSRQHAPSNGRRQTGQSSLPFPRTATVPLDFTNIRQGSAPSAAMARSTSKQCDRQHLDTRTCCFPESCFLVSLAVVGARRGWSPRACAVSRRLHPSPRHRPSSASWWALSARNGAMLEIFLAAGRDGSTLQAHADRMGTLSIRGSSQSVTTAIPPQHHDLLNNSEQTRPSRSHWPLARIPQYRVQGQSDQ
ncbi:hypothetical protein B0T11DRAFT_280704 [Plectosphaerella cucumerina]|uniref:Uncharacterized protein n=1 Tax=Plectosphaerella cucumerina TaxID=40658 RepID=A0A8K0X534_9PEZI|nr:hypothetical protein B0T11DRAFT_280704 [Plectosphaerella cucumerina]